MSIQNFGPAPMLNMKRSLLEMHPKFEKIPGLADTDFVESEGGSIQIARTSSASRLPYLGLFFGAEQSAEYGHDFGLQFGMSVQQISDRESALSRRENEKEQIRHSTQWISKKEMHLCR